MKAKTASIARPKIIGVLDLIKSTWSVYSAHWQKFATILVIPLTLSFVINVILFLVEYFGAHLAWYWWLIIGILTAVIMLAFFILYFLSYVAQFLLLQDLSQAVTFGNLKSLLLKVKPYFWTILAVSAVYGLLSVFGFILLIVPGVIFMVYYGFTIYFVIFENKKFEGSFGLSRDLVRNYWWAVFGRMILGMLIVYLFYLLVGGIIALVSFLLTHFAGLTIDKNGSNLLYSLLSIFIGLVVGPITIIYTYNIFQSLRAAKQLPLIE